VDIEMGAPAGFVGHGDAVAVQLKNAPDFGEVEASRCCAAMAVRILYSTAPMRLVKLRTGYRQSLSASANLHRGKVHMSRVISTIRGVGASRIALPLLALATLAPASVLAQENPDDWKFAASIYGWFPDIEGHTNIPVGSGDINVDVGTILDHLQMTVQGSFAFHKGRWGGFTDLVYLDVGESKSQTRTLELGGQPLPVSVTTNLNFDLKSVFWTLGGSYRFVDEPGATADFLAGARLASFEQSLDWEFSGNFGPVTPPPITGSRSSSLDQWDAIVGVRGQFALGANGKWLVPYHLDVGTGDSDLTWQGVLGLGYAFGWGDLKAVWRYLDYDLDSDQPIRDMNFSGPAVGATFRW